MSQQSRSQPASGSQPRPPKCYNCGADHYLMACPEPVRDVPAGLAAAHAARAASAAHSPDLVDSGHSGPTDRPYKRQKTASVTTRYPAGPVVTHYAPPPAQAGQTQGYYGPQPVQTYQQHFSAPPQPYPQHMPAQQNMGYGPCTGQPTPPGYHPSMTLQGYGQTNANLSGHYMQPLSNTVSPQYGHLGGHYHEGPTQQSYGYDASGVYGPQQITGHQPQSYSNYQGFQSFDEQSYRQHSQFSGPSPVQVSRLPPGPHQQVQTWERPYQGQNAYSRPNHQQPNHPQFERPHLNHQNNMVPQRRPSYQAPGSSSGPILPRQSSGVNSASRQSSITPKVRQSSAILNFQQGWEDVLPPTSEDKRMKNLNSGDSLERTNNEHDWRTEIIEWTKNDAWELEHIFAEPKQHTADPIGYPLPLIHHEDPILPPAYNAEGIVCKYVRPTNCDTFTRDIRLSPYWPSLKSDPVFRDIDFSAPPKVLDEYAGWLQDRFLSRRGAIPIDSDSVHQTSNSRKRAFSGEQVEKKDHAMNGAPSNGVVSRDCHRNHISSPAIRDNIASTSSLGVMTKSSVARSGTPSFGVDDDAWAPQPGEGHFTTSPTEDPTETLLASLGVTGLPKPVPSKQPGFHSGHRHDSMPENSGRHHDSGYGSQRNSYSNGSASTTENPATYRDYRPKYNRSNPPPPPPPPLHMRRQVDGNHGSPSSDGSAHCYNGSAASMNENGNHVTNQTSSPITPTITETKIYNVMSYKERKNSEKASHLRQEDDVTPKLKRRQPKVADAYSRRW